MSFVTFICLTYRDSQYNRELGRDNGRIPSSKQASAPASAADVYRAPRAPLHQHAVPTGAPQAGGGPWGFLTPLAATPGPP
jgi:hypothetical protein